jgi:cytosine/adenosine deaminase-related metal-dependent hydrolase
MAQNCRWRFDAVLRGPSPFVGEDDDPNHGHFRVSIVSMGIFVPPFGDTHTHILLYHYRPFWRQHSPLLGSSWTRTRTKNRTHLLFDYMFVKVSTCPY